PDGRTVLGGAPCNVTWNLQGLGLKPTLLSAVGADTEGEQVRAALFDWGCDLSGIHFGHAKPTGKVMVQFKDQEPHYDIVEDCAYDWIETDPKHWNNRDYGLLYVGTLALRTAFAQQSFNTLRKNLDIPLFVDVNRREPWFSEEVLEQILPHAAWVKMNRDELAFLSQQACETRSQVEDSVAQLRVRYGPAMYWITCGADGAYAMTPEECLYAPAPPVKDLVDTVGAGDAFSSIVIRGVLQECAHAETLSKALAFAAKVCTLRGATCTEQAFYLY
ncbi:MAG: PfkB family carbohydrate kinase, partial [Myxococcota bacterium]